MNNEAVFIVGLPRTGSTLLRTLLNRSDRVCITMETHFLHQFARLGRKKRIARFGDLAIEKNVDAFLDDLFTKKRAAGNDFWAWLNKNTTRQSFRERLLTTDRSDRAIFELFMQLYAEKKKGAVSPNLIMGEKTSANMYYVPTLLEWYPEAKIIHTFRDPRGIFVSAVKLVKAGKWGVKEKLPPLPPALMNSTLEMIMAVYVMRTWLDASRLHAVYAKQYPDQYYLIRFEDFLQDPEMYVRGACDFLNVPFQPEMLEEVKVIGSSYNAQRIVNAGGIDKKAAERWKEHIHPLTRAWFSTLGRRQLENFGYVP